MPQVALDELDDESLVRRFREGLDRDAAFLLLYERHFRETHAFFRRRIGSSELAAEQIARHLLAENLIACANLIDGVTSLYRWEGEIRHDSEVALILKTRTALLPEVVATIKKIHPYDCPCVAAWPITAGNPEFMRWIETETAKPRDLLA